ncbi:Cyclin A3 [Perilla frutescens var. hirtella]|uniref:Cyclin A3 n=1 Tax=Perilla frutescens var. hirtella TaxID=608512 RepID=A0AAD4IS65_PERFH|nr:Cyclin A3 [Perilla frutescens var. hirtella]
MKRNWNGIDENNSRRKRNTQEAKSDDPQMCGVYASYINEYLHLAEKDARLRVCSDYIMKVQWDVNSWMRESLVNWLVDVAEGLDFQSDTTLYLTVSYVDRFLSLHAINRDTLQLLGVSSLFIAWKYEDVNDARARERLDNLCYAIHHECTRDQILKMESDVLISLGFKLGYPTTKTFLRQNLKLEFLGYYIGELSLLSYACLKFLPSLVAASVIFLSRFTLQPQQHPWNSALQQYSGYKASDLKECVGIIHDLQTGRRESTLLVIREKYEQHEFKCVSRLSSPAQVPESFFQDIKDER